MSLVLPKEEASEEIFSRILTSREACRRLRDVFYEHLGEDELEQDQSPEHLAEVLFQAYRNGDVSAVLLELCNRSMFDLLREAYLIPKRFHGKSGENPVLLTDVDGKLLKEKKTLVSRHEFEKFKEVYETHSCAPRSKIYLADGYDLVRYFTHDMEICEKKENRKRGIFVLYALPDTIKLGLTEAQVYDVIWNTFQEIQKEAFSAMVYYGQDTGLRAGKGFDEIGVLLPIHEFEHRMLQHMDVIDGLVLSSREEMIKKAGADSFEM